jgi:hypothetical protein
MKLDTATKKNAATAAALVAASFLCALGASDESPVNLWFGVMSFGTGMGAALAAIFAGVLQDE